MQPEHEMPAPQKKGMSATSKVLIGCSVIAVLLLVLGAAGCYWFFSKALIRDAAEVEQLAAEILPGAKAPEGYQGHFGVDFFGVKMALLGPPDALEGEARTLIVVASAPPDSKTQLETEVTDRVTEETGGGDGKEEELGSETIPVGGRDVSFRKRRVTEDGQATIQFIASVTLGSGRAGILMFMGPEDAFDRAAMDAFLASVESLGE